MQGIQFLAFMSSVIISAVEDVASFSFIMFVIIVVCAAAFAICGSDAAGFDLLTTYALLLGDFDQDIYFSSGMIAGLFTVFTFLMVIVLLNIAIGIIGDTLERIQDQKEMLTLQIRAEMVQTYQRSMVSAFVMFDR